MSLARLAAQLCAVQALLGNTLVGSNVRDSETGLIRVDADGNIATSEQRPFINVFSDDERHEDGRRSLMDSGRFTMAFEFGVTGSMPIVTAEGSYLVDADTGQIILAEREKPLDAEINIVIEIIDRQIRVALSDPDNPWAELWRKFLRGPYAVDSIRGASDKDSLRFGARKLTITGGLLAEPPYRSPVADGSAWRAFLDALDGSQIAHLKPDFEQLLGTAESDDGVDLLRRRYGHTIGEATKLGYAPVRTEAIAGHEIDEDAGSA